MPIKAHGFLSLPHSLKPLLAFAEARSLAIPLLRQSDHTHLVRHYTSGPSSPSPNGHNIAVVGGGITGLATAYYLSKRQGINVTLYEASNRLGGWIQTKHVEVTGGKVLFEQGPRTLRPTLPNGILAAGLVEELELTDSMLFTSRNSIAASNRWIYYPDRLVQVPHPSMGIVNIGFSLATEPVFRGVASGMIHEFFAAPNPPGPLDVDESIGDFISRRFNGRVVDNLLSAIIHGIYAGDVWQLSADMLMPKQRFYEQQYNGLLTGMARDRTLSKEEDAKLLSTWSKSALPVSHELWLKLRQASFFTFKQGMAELAMRLEDTLRKRDNVELKTNTSVASVFESSSGAGKLEIHTTVKDTSNSQTVNTQDPNQNNSTTDNILYDQIILTTGSGALLSDLALPRIHQFTVPPSVTVGVVNLYFSNPNLLPVSGFGYLIPQSIPFDQNPELALGVVFDSDAVQGQDSVLGTKLTVMLGGHWWNSFGSLPSEEQCLDMARTLLKRHLKIQDEPTATNVVVQKHCIPQYPVGYRKNVLVPIHEALLKEYQGRLKVCGSRFHGVGVSDCIRAAADIVESALGPEWRGKTGLERFAKAQEWATLEPSKMPKDVRN